MAEQITTGFAAGTLVYTPDGHKPIEGIRVGDLVLSFPEDQPCPTHMRKKDEYTYRRVAGKDEHDIEAFCAIEILAFADDVQEQLRVAPEHPFYVDHKGWVPANKLGPQSGVLVNCVFGNVVASQVVVRRERTRAYNLEIDGFHTYYVGRASTWVHDGALAL